MQNFKVTIVEEGIVLMTLEYSSDRAILPETVTSYQLELAVAANPTIMFREV